LSRNVEIYKTSLIATVSGTTQYSVIRLSPCDKILCFLRKRYPSIQRVFLTLSARPACRRSDLSYIDIPLFTYTYIFPLHRTLPPTIFNDSINDRSHGWNVYTPLSPGADNNCRHSSPFAVLFRLLQTCILIIILCTHILIDLKRQMHTLAKYFKSCDLSSCVLVLLVSRKSGIYIKKKKYNKYNLVV